MSEDAPGVSSSSSSPSLPSRESSPESRASISVEGLKTYLHCPRRYEFAHVHGLDGDDGSSASSPPRSSTAPASTTDRRLEYCRQAICDALRTGETDRDALEERALTRLAQLWDGRSDEDAVRFHSYAQRSHERRVLEATIDAYLEAFGEDHARGLAALDSSTDGELVGPDLPLSTSVKRAGREEAERENESESETATASVDVESTVDYVYRDGPSIVGVRFVPTLIPLGLLRFRSEWDGDVAALFEAHVDPDDETFEPGPAGVLLETAAVLDGLRDLRDRLELGDGDLRCRYRYISLADRSSVQVNWARETVEAGIETIDLTDVFLDHHTYGMTLEHRNQAVESKLLGVANAVADGVFDPSAASDRWERIVANSCGHCGYTVCCQEYLAEEVRFDG